jgi:16S rRNA (adenine1518-N6/adenine1519-N6)-dimethyltransferase
VNARAQSLRPRKSLGQNFLRDENIARNIVAALGADADDIVLEIGPGQGALTRYLASLVRHLIVVEVDRRMIVRLEEQYRAAGVEILHEDILSIDVGGLARRYGRPLRVVGNIPYNITTPIVFHVLDHRASVADVLMLMQREVARRIIARPNTKEYGILSVFCQLYADAEILFDVSPHAFVPKPGVVSSLVRLAILKQPRFPVDNEVFFRGMVRAVFGKRRKMLRNSLKYFLDTERATFPGPGSAGSAFVDLDERPEQLSVEELVRLSNILCTCAPGAAT